MKSTENLSQSHIWTTISRNLISQCIQTCSLPVKELGQSWRILLSLDGHAQERYIKADGLQIGLSNLSDEAFPALRRHLVASPS